MSKIKRNSAIVLATAVVSVAVMAFQNCSGTRGTGADRAVDQSSTGNGVAPATAKLPRQFGYWGSAVDGIDRDPAGEYVREVADHSNVVFVNGIDPKTLDVSPERIKHKIELARADGLRVVLAVQSLFFAWDTVKVLPNANARFDALWADLGDLRSTVAGFYVFDEPYGNNLHFAPDRRIHWTLVRDGLNAVADHLRAAAPGIPSIVVFGAEEIGYANFYTDLNPDRVSWIGFDCYRFEGARCSETAVRDHFSRFAAMASATGQGLVLVPDAFSHVSPNDDDQRATVARVRLYEELATHRSVEGVYPWLFQDHVVDGQTRYWGARSLPFVRDEIRAFYDKFRGSSGRG